MNTCYMCRLPIKKIFFLQDDVKLKVLEFVFANNEQRALTDN